MTIDEGAGRRVFQFQLDAAILLQHLDIEIGIGFENAEGVVIFAAGRQHGQRAAPQQRIEAALAGVAQARNLVAREYVHAGDRSDACIDRGEFRCSCLFVHG